MLKFNLPSFTKTTTLLNEYDKIRYLDLIREFGPIGVDALSRATPVDTQETANSWDFRFEESNGRFKIIWTNSKMAGNVPVVVLLQYGHAARDGTYVPGHDFINPALAPIVAAINKKISAEVG